MLPLALRDPVSLYSMPFAVLIARVSFKKDFVQSTGQCQVHENSVRMEESAFREWEVAGVGTFCVNADRGLDRTNVASNRVVA